jgi:NRPS condensation-like uncharacterized protein
MKIKNFINLLLILSLALPIFSFAQQQTKIKQPENLEEAKEMGKQAIETTQKELPGILKKIWKEEALPVWQKMWEWFRENILVKIESLFKSEYEKKKPEVKEEFKKKTEEIKKETPQFLGKILEKFSSLLRK